MDEREVHELFRGAAETVQPSPDLPERAERRYRTRRARGRVLVSAVVVALIGSGIATAAAISGGHSRSDISRPAPIAVPARVVDANTFNSFAFVDARTGYGVATAGTEVVLAKTEDGTRSWHVIGSMPTGVRHIELAGPPGDRDAVLIAWGDGVYRSTDQGNHWKKRLPSAVVVVMSPGRSWASQSCAGLGVCNTRLLFSDDSGRSWHQWTDTLPAGNGMTAIVAPTRETAYVVGLSGPSTIGLTSDGGRHWRTRATPCENAWKLAVSGDHRSLMLVCSDALRQNWRVYFSHDEAKTWTAGPPLPRNSPVYSVGAVGDSRFAVGLGGWSKGPLIGPVLDQWALQTLPQPFGEVHAIANVPGGMYFASTRSGIWFRSDDDKWDRRTPSATNQAAPTGPPTAGFLAAPTGADVHELSVWGWNGDKVATLSTKSACCSVSSVSPDGSRVFVSGDGTEPPEVLDVHGTSLAHLDPIVGPVVWADDSRHLCELRPHEKSGAVIATPADVVLVDPGHGERTVAQVAGWGPHSQPSFMRCSVVDDQAIVGNDFAGRNTSVTGVQLSSGRVFSPKWAPAPTGTEVVAISGNGRYVVESEAGAGLRYAIVDTLSNAVVGHVDGQAMQLSWDGHLVVELINGFDVAVVDWRSGAVLWRSANRHEVPGGPGGIVSGATVSARPESDDLALNVNALPGRNPNVAQLWLVTPSTPPKLLANEVAAGIV